MKRAASVVLTFAALAIVGFSIWNVPALGLLIVAWGLLSLADRLASSAVRDRREKGGAEQDGAGDEPVEGEITMEVRPRTPADPV